MILSSGYLLSESQFPDNWEMKGSLSEAGPEFWTIDFEMPFPPGSQQAAATSCCLVIQVPLLLPEPVFVSIAHHCLTSSGRASCDFALFVSDPGWEKNKQRLRNTDIFTGRKELTSNHNRKYNQ